MEDQELGAAGLISMLQLSERTCASGDVLCPFPGDLGERCPRQHQWEGHNKGGWAHFPKPPHLQTSILYYTGGKHKARGPKPALHFVLSNLAPCFYRQHSQTLTYLLRSSYIYTVLKLHSALWRQLWGWCGPWWNWVWNPHYFRCAYYFVNISFLKWKWKQLLYSLFKEAALELIKLMGGKSIKITIINKLTKTTYLLNCSLYHKMLWLQRSGI